MPGARRRRAAEDAGARAARLEGRLLEQLEELGRRMERMDREQERYCLVEVEGGPGARRFAIAKQGDARKVKIVCGAGNAMHCSCLDWKTRCKRLALPCKHIFYLLARILDYPLFDYHDNTVMKPQVFEEQIERRVLLDAQRFRTGALGAEPCPICFAELGDNEAKLRRCPDCPAAYHVDCVGVWMRHSTRRNCPLCRSERWAAFSSEARG